LDRQCGRIVVGIERDLPTIGAKHLPEVTFLVKETDGDDRDTHVTRRLEMIAREDAESACVERHALAQTELHAQVADRLTERRSGRLLRDGLVLVASPFLENGFELASKFSIARQLAEAGTRCVLENDPGTPCRVPGLGIDLAPQAIALAAPGPAEVQRQLGQRAKTGRQVARKEGVDTHSVGVGADHA
jgi:hypothetical protein